MGDGSVFGQISEAYGKNHYDLDRPFQQLLRYFAPHAPDLSDLGAFAGRELYEVADYVDKVARPRLVSWSVRGEPVDAVWIDRSEREVLVRLTREFGVHRSPYRGGSWFDHYAAIYLISDPGIACILTVTNQTAYALHKYGDAAQRALVPRLIGEDPEIAYGATWFTERQGGSDLGANRVRAHRVADGWRISGDTKYFASNAGLADYALVSARPEGAPEGPKGLGLFLVPRTDSHGRRNFAVRRLKDKSATASVPTGEVEFHEAEASVVGDLANGIYYLLENLMVSRLSNSFGALGVARKAFLEAYFYAQHRSAFGRRLVEHPLVQRDLFEMEVALEGALALALKAVGAFDRSWSERPPYDEGYHYARLLTHIAKNVTAETAAQVTQTAMELFGGIGFLHEYPVERLHREALVLPIWEGPSNIQALDLLEVLQKKRAHVPLLRDLRAAGKEVADGQGGTLVTLALERTEAALQALVASGEREAQFIAKEAVRTLGHALAVTELVRAARKVEIPRFEEVAGWYASRYLEGKPYPAQALDRAEAVFTIDRSP